MPPSTSTARRRDRTGQVQEYRAKLVGVQTFVDEKTRDQFNKLAEAAGMSTAELLRHVVREIVARGSMSEVSKARQDADNSVLKNVLASITTPRPV